MHPSMFNFLTVAAVTRFGSPVRVRSRARAGARTGDILRRLTSRIRGRSHPRLSLHVRELASVRLTVCQRSRHMRRIPHTRLSRTRPKATPCVTVLGVGCTPAACMSAMWMCCRIETSASLDRTLPGSGRTTHGSRARRCHGSRSSRAPTRLRYARRSHERAVPGCDAVWAAACLSARSPLEVRSPTDEVRTRRTRRASCSTLEGRHARPTTTTTPLWSLVCASCAPLREESRARSGEFE